MIHELQHALGIFHEHERPDRDDHVDVHLENVDPDARDQFEINPSSMADTSVLYDVSSNMHYEGYVRSLVFSINATTLSQCSERINRLVALA